VVLAHAGREDWVLCQVTSSPYGDPSAIAISDECFSQGSLRINSFARPGKLFTASSTLMLSEVGTLKVNVARQIIRAIIMILRSGIEQGDVEHGTPG
jgi:mRNA interferase MazF